MQYTSNVNERNIYFQEDLEGSEAPHLKIKFLVPAIWALIVSTGVYTSLAYRTAKQEVDEVGIYKQSRANWAISRETSSFPYVNRSPPTPTEVATRAWSQTDPMSKLSWSLIGFNGAVHLTKFVAPSAWSKLWHIPVTNRNYTLLTSVFVHSGPMHLAVNMFAMYQFLPITGRSALFRGDTNHMLSFFLATGVMSGVTQHAASVVFKHGRAYSAFIPSGGASGALFAVFAAFCMEYPRSEVGILFIPFHIEAQYFLPAVMLFDLIGMVRGFGLGLGHGVCIQLSYSDG